MMQFRYKITKDILWGGYTLYIQYQVITCAKWKKFKRVDLFDACVVTTGDWYICPPSAQQQFNYIGRCIKSYGSMRDVVIAYISIILQDKKKKMDTRNDTKNIKQMIDGLVNRTWSDVIVIDENEISEE